MRASSSATSPARRRDVTGENDPVQGARGDYSDDGVLVDALCRRDDAAFAWLLDRYDGSLRRLARNYVPSAAVADEVVQETWLAVIRGIDGFERRSSLKTWLFRILMNVARTRGVREQRTIPFSSARGAMEEGSEPAVDPDRFLPADSRRPGHWASLPTRWEHEPEERLLSAETTRFVSEAIDMLPPAQREVITLRDIEGWTSVEVCNALSVSETNQRVLLHRARAKVRRALEAHFESAGT
jgi:RNA polymerase sigma-70 factor (ECF subfamily)